VFPRAAKSLKLLLALLLLTAVVMAVVLAVVLVVADARQSDAGAAAPFH
jgi:hypothetical protein